MQSTTTQRIAKAAAAAGCMLWLAGALLPAPALADEASKAPSYQMPSDSPEAAEQAQHEELSDEQDD